MKPLVTIVVVTWNSSHLLPQLSGVLEKLRPICELVVSDNASTDGSPDMISHLLPWARIVKNPINGGFGYGNNRGIEVTDTPFVLLLNTDASISPDSLEGLITVLNEYSTAAGVQPLIRLSGWPLITLSAGAAMTEFGRGYDLDFMHFQPFPSRRCIEVPAVTAAVSLFRSDALKEIGGFDENIFMYYEDLDLCLRLRAAGWRFVTSQQNQALHMMGASSTRSAADVWELVSSLYMTRKYLGKAECVLPGYWMRNEWRARLSSLKHGKPWMWRIAAVRRGKGLKATHVELPDAALQDVLALRPLRMPVRRPVAARENIGSGDVYSGPGWLGGMIRKSGFGCLEVPEDAGLLSFEIRTCNIAGSVGLWSSEGLIQRKFLADNRIVRFQSEIARGITRLYVVPDRMKQMVGIHEVEYSF